MHCYIAALDAYRGEGCSYPTGHTAYHISTLQGAAGMQRVYVLHTLYDAVATYRLTK